MRGLDRPHALLVELRAERRDGAALEHAGGAPADASASRSMIGHAVALVPEAARSSPGVLALLGQFLVLALDAARGVAAAPCSRPRP